MITPARSRGPNTAARRRSDILAWALLRIRRGTQRAAPMIAALATTLLVAVLGGLAWNVQATVASDLVDGGSLAVIEVRADTAEARPLTASALDAIAGLEGVAAVEPALDGASLYASDGGWVLPIAAYQPSQPPPGIVESPPPGAFLAPARAQGVDFAARVGQRLDLEITTRTGAGEGTSAPLVLTLAGTYDPAWQVYGPGVALLPFETALEVVAAREGMTPEAYLDGTGVISALVVAGGPADVDPLTAELRARGFAASPLADRLGRLPAIFTLLPVAAGVAAGLGALILLATTATGIATMVRGQVRDLALLRVNGWSVVDIRRLVVTESVLATAAGALAGGLVAALVTPVASAAAAELLGSDPGLMALGWRPAVASAAVILGGIGASAMVARLAARRSLRTDPYLVIGRSGA